MTSSGASSVTVSLPSGLGFSDISSDISAGFQTRTSASASDSTLTTSSASLGPTSDAESGSTAGPGSPAATSGVAPGAAPAEPSASSAAASPNNTPATPVVVGGVVGGIAGFAVLLLVALLFLRWYKRRGTARQALDGGDDELGGAAAPPMTQGSSRFPPVAAAGAFLNRLSSTRTPPPPTERGFQRVSGRKLPSAFSGAAGPDSEPTDPFADPMPGAVSQDKSFYRDSQGVYGLGAGAAGAAASQRPPHDLPAEEVTASSAAAIAEGEKERFHPGPARTPVIHPGGPYSPTVVRSTTGESDSEAGSPPRQTSPPPMTPSSGTLPRSQPSFDASRGSRFTENVDV
jgi:hypothetical protein